jgi:hypothetical protein
MNDRLEKHIVNERMVPYRVPDQCTIQGAGGGHSGRCRLCQVEENSLYEKTELLGI